MSQSSSSGAKSAFEALCRAAEGQGWYVAIYDGPVVAVCTTGNNSNYSRTVQPGESFDRCAEIIHDGLHRSKVLPKASK